MLKIGRKGKRELKFFEMDKIGDLSFIDKNPNDIYFIDITIILQSLPVYKKNLMNKLETYKNIYGINYKQYKNWMIVGKVNFEFPELRIIR